MPTTTVDITARTEGELTHILVQRGDDALSSVVTAGKLTTISAAIEWTVNQVFKTLDTAEIQRRVTFTFHQEVNPDGDTVIIVDSIDDVQLLPRDQGKTDFEALPGWATWTAQEAVDWIETNVTDLASAKTTLQQMARAIVALRNRTID